MLFATTNNINPLSFVASDWGFLFIMKKLLLLPIALLLFNCTTDSTGCPTIETYRTYGQSNARYTELNLSDGTTVTKPLSVVEKQVGGSDLIGREYCE